MQPSMVRSGIQLLGVLLAVLSGLLPAGARAAPPTLVVQSTVTAPASISELARALKHDANLIYEFVYTNIEYSPTYGVKKGALGTLITNSGNDMDQAALLVALLRQSGFTARYVHGSIRLTVEQVTTWLGVPPTVVCGVQNLLTQGGIPFVAHTTIPGDCASALLYIDIDHTWVAVTGGAFGSTTFVFDPSYKTYEPPDAGGFGLGLAFLMGYDRFSFMADVTSSSTITPTSIQNIDAAKISSALVDYSNNLRTFLEPYKSGLGPNFWLGGRYIKPLTQPYTPTTSLPYETPGSTPDVWSSEIPNEYRTTLRISIGGIDKTYYSDQIYGHRLTIAYNASAQPVLYADGVVEGTGSANAATISYVVNFPFCFATAGPPSPTCGAGFTDLFTFQNSLRVGVGFTYAIVNGWDSTSRGMVEFHRRQLQVNKASGASDNSEAVLGEALNLIGFSWLAQRDAAARLFDRLIFAKTVRHCEIGVVGQTTGPYIDMPGGFGAVSNLAPDRLSTMESAFWSATSAGSALEWGNIDQALSKSGVGAVSTIKLFDIANQNGIVFFDANSSNWASVRSAISSYYSAGDLNYIQNNLINAGYRVILPQRGNLTQGAWTGAGYIGSKAATGYNTTSLTFGISSNLKGGYSDEPVAPDVWVPDAVPYGEPIIPPAQVVSFDPVDLSSGGFLYNHDDISIGATEFPFGLALRRSYNSNNLYAPSSQGLGWAHNFSITAATGSDGIRGMAQDSIIDGVAAVAAALVILDLYTDTTRPLANVVVASLVQKWMMDRLINNTVNVTIGSNTEQFILLPDGGYNPPLGSSNRLSRTGGLYTFLYKDGAALEFNAAGNVSTWRSPAAGTVSFAYDTSSPPVLTSVANKFGRSLNFSYNDAKQVIAVTDNSSPMRSVNYAYDAAGNLVSFRDPLDNVTTYTYASPGVLAQIYYASNPALPFVTNSYDTLGRVQTQTNANGATWSYFFAGYRSEELDPYGTQHVLYFNPRGKVLFDLQDYGATTPAIAIVNSFLYDELDRLSSATQPEGGRTDYAYDLFENQWANNVVRIDRSPKPGSSLPTLTTTYTYETDFNKPLTVTDPRGIVQAMTYDPFTGRLLSTTADNDGLKARTTYTYTNDGLPLTVTDQVGTVTQFDYDEFANRTLTVRNAGLGWLNQTTTVAYNSRGDPISTTDPVGNVTVATYDDARRISSATAPSGLVTDTSYDPDGRPIQVQQSTTGSVLQTIATTYTPSGKMASAVDANGGVTRYDYDLLDRLAATTDAMGRLTRYTYSALSQPHQTINPGISTNALMTQTWNTDGQRASIVDSNGNITTYFYDGFGRLAETSYPNGTTETFTYDANGNIVTRKTRAGGTIDFTYDTLNRLITKTPPTGPAVSYTYDLASRLKSASDNSSALASAVSPTGDTISYTASYAYDVMNRPISVSWAPVATAAAPAGASSVTFGYSYNKVNQRVGQVVSDSGWINYPAATPGTVSYTANSLNQYTAVGAITPTYDTNGNLTSDGTYSLGYDAENRLVSASGAGNTAAYTFDAQGRRKTRTVNATTTVSVTDAQNREVLEYDGSTGALLRWHAYGLGPNAVLGQMNIPANTRTTPVPDLLGSIVGSMDAGTGTLTKFAYRPYGASTVPATPFGFTGQRFDQESGLYYYRARHYSPITGRFVQADPLGYEGGVNLYAYVGNDSINRIDPEGLWSLDINLLIAGVSIGIGSNSYQPFAAGRVGFVGAGVTYDPSGDVPLGKSGQYPGTCAYCTVGRTYWETTQKGSVGVTVGPLNISVLSKPGDTLVNEYNQSGQFQSSQLSLGGPTEIGLDITYSAQKKFGAKLDASYYWELGTSIPWGEIAGAVSGFFGGASPITGSGLPLQQGRTSAPNFSGAGK